MPDLKSFTHGAVMRFAICVFVAAASVLIVPAIADAGPLGNPLDDVSDSSPTSSYAAPTGYGNLTGADGDVGNSKWIAVTDSGFGHIMDGANSSPLATIDTGISGLTGVAITGYDNDDFLVALCAGTTIYEGKLSQTAWTQSNTIDLTTSNLTDIDYALGAYFIATESDEIRKVGAGGSTSAVNNARLQAYDVIVFQPSTYDNNMSQLDGEGFMNIDIDGIPIGGAGNSGMFDLNNWTAIQGVAHFDGGIALAEGFLGEILPEQAYQQHMQEVPEPVTLTLLGIGGLGLLVKRKSNRSE